MAQGTFNSQRKTGSSFTGRLLPFNEARFEDCLAFLAGKHNKRLSVYEMMKLHVMIDVFHTIEHGKPVIGGELWPFTNGPVARCAKNHVTGWEDDYQNTGKNPDCFRVEESADRVLYAPKSAPPEEEFSGSELDAMTRAWETVMPVLEQPDGFAESQRYFHSESFIGRAWARAKHKGRDLNWDDIVDEYDKEFDTDHSHIKTIMRY